VRVLCRHGHYAFYSETEGDIAEFCEHFGITLTREDDYYTFPALKTLDRYSLKGKMFLNLEAEVNYEGRHPWEVMREHGFVYHIGSSRLLPKSSIAVQSNPKLCDGFWIADFSVIQAGAITKTGRRILSYDGFFLDRIMQLRLNEISYE
jgi:hypothetical protein